MPVIRNTRFFATKTLTIKRFVAGEAIATNVYPFLWLGLNNTSIVDDAGLLANHTGFKAGSSVIIRCEIATDAVGPICGVTGKARIVAESGYLTWYDNDNTLAYSVAIDGKIHDIGFIYDTNTTRPFYDGVINASMVYPTYERDLVIGGLTTNATNSGRTGTPISSSSSTYAIKVYEVAGLFEYYGNSSSTGLTFGHFYACGASADATTGFMYDTRTDFASKMTPSGSGTKGLGTLTQPYGVSLNDLQTAFGNAYEQLLAVIGQDNGVDRGGVGTEDKHAGWLDPVAQNEDKAVNADTAQIVTTTEGGVTRSLSLAFYLQAAYLPAGATITNPTDVNDYENGDLIRGRQPLWSIWNNSVNFGKYIKKIHITSPTDHYEYKFGFNIFKDVYGRNIFNLTDPDILGVFDGYSNSQNAMFAPWIKAPVDAQILKFYNDEEFDPDASGSQMYNGTSGEGGAYPYNKLGSGSFKARLGNLPWWNMTKAEQQARENYCDIYGMAVKMQMRSEAEWSTISNFYALTDDANLPLCSESSQTVKDKFKTNGIELNMTYGGYTDLARLSDEFTFKTRGILSMMRTRTTAPNEQTDLVDCSTVVPSVEMSASVQRNFRNLNLIGEQNGKTVIGTTSYDIYLQANTFPTNYMIETYTSLESSAQHGAKGLQFMLIPSSITSPSRSDAIDLFNNDGTPKVYVYAEMTQMRSWAAMLGNYGNNVIVSVRSSFPSSGSSSNNYVDKETGKIYHWVGGTTKYEEDTKTDVSSLPAVGSASYTTTYYVTTNGKYYRLSRVLVAQGYTGTDAYVEFPYRWAKKGSIYNKYNGFAVPLRYADIPSDGTFHSQANPWGTSTSKFWIYNKSVAAPADGRDDSTDGGKVALSAYYFNFLDLGNTPDNVRCDGPRMWDRNSNVLDEEPCKARYRIFDANHLPHAWGVFNKNTQFSDAGEGWIFGKNGNTYLVIDSEHILNEDNRTIIDVYLRLWNSSNVEKYLATDFVPFSVNVYRQDACRPYQFSNNAYQHFDYYRYKDPRLNGSSIDDTKLYTQVLSSVNVDACNTDYSKTEGGIKYNVRCSGSTDLNDGAVKYSGVASSITDKFGSLNPYCYHLVISIDSTSTLPSHGGSTYLLEIV